MLRVSNMLKNAAVRSFCKKQLDMPRSISGHVLSRELRVWSLADSENADYSNLSSDYYSRVPKRRFNKRYELFPGGPVESAEPEKQDGESKQTEEGPVSSRQEGDENEVAPPHIPQQIFDLPHLPQGPTHKEMIAARRHYLKRQARRGLLPPSRPIRSRFPLDDS